MSTIISAHYDGRVIVPDEPLSLQPGEKVRVTIERDSEAKQPQPRRRAGGLKGKIRIGEKFAEPLPDFEEYK
ncbi:MAG: antitoxin AF2212-like protein [Planctomycetota bacterium]|nr:antitoxin AF2212-like protein [Planctomycetota bacterium]